MALTLQQAHEELRHKTIRAIQEDTAVTWCHRAIAAASMGNDEDAKEYGHEAIEHAALSGSDQLLRWVRRTCAEAGIGL